MDANFDEVWVKRICLLSTANWPTYGKDYFCRNLLDNTQLDSESAPFVRASIPFPDLAADPPLPFGKPSATTAA
jgi:hypothetical protein